MKTLDNGAKVKYRDANGELQKGVVHGVRKYEDAKGKVTKVTYLVDTGDDERVDEFKQDVRDIEYAKRVDALVAKGMDHKEASQKVEKEGGLPKSKVVTETVRQPLTVEVDANDIE